MKRPVRVALFVAIGSAISTVGLGLFLYGFADSNPGSSGILAPQYTLSVSGFLSLVLGFALCWPKARKSFVTVCWSFLSWLSVGCAAICAFLIGAYISDCLNPHGDALICNSVQLISELSERDATTQASLEFTGVLLFGLGQLVVMIAMQPKVIYGNAFVRRKDSGILYEEIIES